MGYGSLHERRDQHLVLNSQAGFQQARLLTMDYRLEFCFYQSQDNIDLLLRDMDIYPMYIVPNHHGFRHRHVVETLHRGWYKVQPGPCHSNSTFNFLRSQPQMDLRSSHVQAAIFATERHH